MFISQQLRKTNIAEYVLYMWQVEDIIRAYNCDLTRIKKEYIARFDLDEEHEQAAKKIVRKPANYSLEGKPKRERKPNEEKRMLIAFVGKALEGAEVENVTVANVEREVTFRVGENEYSLTLTCHRKPKQK